MSKRRVLFVLKYREQPPGSIGWGDGTGNFLHSGLYNSANFVCRMLQDNGIEAKLVHVADNNHIHREIVQYRATDVIVEAFWVVPEKFDVLHRACPNVNFIIRNHSETPFLANEGMALDWTLQYVTKPNVVISCNAPRMLRETRVITRAMLPHLSNQEVDSRVPFLPNYYPLNVYIRSGIDHSKEELHVGCFGAVRPLKNQLLQAIAAIEFAEREHKKLRFHVNAGRIEMNGSPILRNLKMMFEKYGEKHQLIEEPWRAHTEFKQLVASMDIVMQVSFSETFNIVAADAISQGVPTITSSEVPWSATYFQANPVDSVSMVNALDRAYNANPNFNPSLQGLDNYNNDSVKIWTKYFADND